MRELRVISIGSGKGGVGKTTIAYALSLMFQKGKRKVLLIDFDLYTQGLSRFFESEILSQKNKIGLLDMIGEFDIKKERTAPFLGKDDINSLIIKSGDIDIVPVSKKFFADMNKLDEKKLEMLRSLLWRFINSIKKMEMYDYVIIDNHAGICKTLEHSLEKADDFIIVTEADRISEAITRDFQNFFSNHISREKMFVFVNKIVTENAEKYVEMIKYLDIVNYLPPLPLDYSIVRAFVLKNPIIDFADPSAFFFALFNIIERVYPKDPIISDLRKEIKIKIVRPVTIKINRLNNEISKLDIEIDEIKYGYERKISKFNQYFFQSIGIPVGVLIGLIFFSLTTTSLLFDANFIPAVITLFSLILIPITLLLLFRVKLYDDALESRKMNEKKEHSLHNKKYELQRELKTFVDVSKYSELLKGGKLLD